MKLNSRPVRITAIALTALLGLILVIVEVMRPPELDWTPTYLKGDKDPYGCFLVYRRLGDLFPGHKVEALYTSIYDAEEFEYPEEAYDYYFEEEEDSYSNEDEGYYYDEEVYVEEDTYEDSTEAYEFISSIKEDTSKTNYLIITRDFIPDKFDRYALQEHIKTGNTIFIAATNFNYELKEMLEFSVERHDSTEIKDSISLNFMHPNLKADTNYRFKKGSVTHYFYEYPGDSVEVLATNSLNQPVMLRFLYGLGSIYISVTPKAFTNYNLVHPENEEFIEKALSHLNNTHTYWGGRYFHINSEEVEDTSSPLSYIHSQPALTWAFYLLLGIALLYAIFEIKRKQRIIPVIEKPGNSTLKFTKMLAQLYLSSGSNRNVLEKRAQYFYNYIKSAFYVKINQQDEHFYRTVSSKSGLKMEDVQDLFESIRASLAKSDISDEEFLEVNKKIESFKKLSKI